ncbi:MAG: caspase family protein, partial [Magnetospirillum sp.]|nr:caspase family protein [Magnetospirillum sp.]
AYMWAVLASAQARDDLAKRSVARRDEIARRLKQPEIEKAQAQAAAFRPGAEERILAAAAQPSMENVPPLDANRIRGKANPAAVALVIGVEDYEKLPPAQFAGRDARAFRDFAVNTMGIPRDRVRLLLNQDARLLDVQKAVDTWMRAAIADGGEDVFIFFSGHGLSSEDGRSLYLFPHDGDRAMLARSGLDRGALIDAALKAGAKSLTLFLDTCYSGGTRGAETLLADMRPLLIMPKDGEIPGPAAILAAAGGTQLSSAYAPARHGLFSYFLMRGLMGEADADGDHRLTLGELRRFTEEKVRRTAMSQGREQTPVLIGRADTVIAQW